MLNALDIIFKILLLVISIVLIFVVMLQESKTSGMSGAITGEADTAFDNDSYGRTSNAILAKITKICAVLFFIIVLASNLIGIFA